MSLVRIQHPQPINILWMQLNWQSFCLPSRLLRVRVSSSTPNIAGIAQLVEHHVANVIVVGSRPSTCSNVPAQLSWQSIALVMRMSSVQIRELAPCCQHSSVGRAMVFIYLSINSFSVPTQLSRLEPLICNQQVLGSNPRVGSILF